MFTRYFYQPFFNILVGIYWLLGQISPDLADMGIAVIIFALIVRLITFPLTLAGERTEEEKRRILEEVNSIKRRYSHDPVKQKQLIRQVMRRNKRVVLSTTLNLIIQLGIVLMLYRIFTTGLEGKDYHLLYDFMPRIKHVNLTFLGKYDLAHPNNTLNLIQSILIFVVEILVALRSPFLLNRKHIWLMQFILPIGSYLAFSFLPAGKKIFIITSLMFSALYHSFRLAQEQLRFILNKLNPPAQPTSSNQSTQPSSLPQS